MWKSKVLRDIFQDEELMNWLMFILLAIIIGTIVNVILIATHNPPCTLKNDNQTISIITQACKGVLLRTG